MPKPKRTRKQKELTAQRKTKEYNYSLSEITPNVSSLQKPLVREKTTQTVEAFFNYDVKLIYKDIFKTVLISATLIIVLIIISFYLQQ